MVRLFVRHVGYAKPCKICTIEISSSRKAEARSLLLATARAKLGWFGAYDEARVVLYLPGGVEVEDVNELRDDDEVYIAFGGQNWRPPVEDMPQPMLETIISGLQMAADSDGPSQGADSFGVRITPLSPRHSVALSSLAASCRSTEMSRSSRSVYASHGHLASGHLPGTSGPLPESSLEMPLVGEPALPSLDEDRGCARALLPPKAGRGPQLVAIGSAAIAIAALPLTAAGPARGSTRMMPTVSFVCHLIAT